MRRMAAPLSRGVDSDISDRRIFAVGNFKPVLVSLRRIIRGLSRTVPAAKDACWVLFKVYTCFLALIYKGRKFAFLMP